MLTVSVINKRYHKRTHKFGIELLKTVQEALEIDAHTGTTYWRDALDLEMKNVRVAFDAIKDEDKITPGYTQINCHLVFDIKMGSLHRKCHLVVGGHMTEPPTSITYASVVSCESVHIALTIAALNGLHVMATDIKNAYLNSPCDEKIWTILGPEFRPELEGKHALVICSLYGLCSAGAAYCHHLATCMEHMGYKSCLADPDVWMHTNMNANGHEIYEYILVYTDNILAMCLDPKSELDRLNKYFILKEGSVGPPDIYLGAKLWLVSMENGDSCLTQSTSGYVKEAVKAVEDWLKAHYMRLPSRADTPMSTTYHPELDTSPILTAAAANWYQSAISALWWMVEHARIDLMAEVSIMASHMAMPYEGHLIALLHIFSYVKKHHNSQIAFDPTYSKIAHKYFPKNDWSRFYGEPILPNAPEPKGKPVIL